MHTAVDAGLDPAPRTLTVTRFLQQWLEDVLPGTVSLATERRYRYAVRAYIVRSIGQKRLRMLQARDVSRMLQSLEADGYAPNTLCLTGPSCAERSVGRKPKARSEATSPHSPPA